ncbi:MAG: tetratricopeptide repeat protein [Rhodobacterales bacterium]|nr:tetratricopeptide repeat protein [Rhodobacterales bacterium]
MSKPNHALVATVAYFGDVVEEHQVPRGRSLQIGGNSTSLAVPMPLGVDFLARCSWTHSQTVAVVDGRGRQYVLTPDDSVSLEIGPIQLKFTLAPQYSFRRTSSFNLVASAAWLAIVLMATVSVETAGMVTENICPWTGLFCPLPERDDGQDAFFTAEYLARLLKEDYAGDDEGVISRDFDREDIGKDSKAIYMPAGHDGPTDKMGGAEETAPDPVRTPKVEDLVLPEKGDGSESPLFIDSEDSEVAIPAQEATEDDGKTDFGSDEASDEDPNIAEAPAEEEQGWGIQDWYDERDASIDDLEIELMVKAAKPQIRTAPDDPSALSVLSYYQYLGEQYDDALDTYDKYISLYPDRAEGYNNKALIYKRQGDFALEERLYRVALALSPNDVTAMNNLAVCLGHQGRFEEAHALMVALETLDKDEPYADLHRAKIYASQGEDALALQFLDKALMGMAKLDTLHHIEFRQDIRLDPSFAKLRSSREFRDILVRYYGDDTPLQD